MAASVFSKDHFFFFFFIFRNELFSSRELVGHTAVKVYIKSACPSATDDVEFAGVALASMLVFNYLM